LDAKLCTVKSASFAAARPICIEERAPSQGLRETMPNASEKIPADLAKELRKLAHDLSNALETIVQAAYLIGQSNPPQDARRFVDLIDNATKDAVKINQSLRQLLRDHS
jgi:hypothetical protein